MTNYTARFICRKVNAIGNRYPIVATVEAGNEQEAEILLYNRFEHISELKLEPFANYYVVSDSEGIWLTGHPAESDEILLATDSLAEAENMLERGSN